MITPRAQLPITDDRRTARLSGLDGLRAIAVGFVLVYHLWPEVLPGGFLGVDIFFVVSGFLIATLLLREHDTHGRIALGAFWQRRARRLLPALGLVVIVGASLAWLVKVTTGNGDLLVNIGAQLLGAIFFVSNWVLIALGGDYFTRDNPELYRHTWSLSIEEQFYLVLPLLLLVVLRARSRYARSLPFLLLASASATLMAVYSVAGVEPTRIYFGSDSHTFGLFAGVFLAMLLHPGGRAAAAGSRQPRNALVRMLSTGAKQTVLLIAAALGLAVLTWLSVIMAEGTPKSFDWGFQLATVAALLAIWAVTRPGSWVGRMIDMRPMRWVGERSYGIYLWHWPLLLVLPELLFGGQTTGAAPVVVLVVSVLCAAASYRFIEQPIRRHGLRVSLRRFFGTLFTRARSQPARWATAFSIVAVVIVCAAGTAAAVTQAPQHSSSAAAIMRGEAAMAAAQNERSYAAIAEHGFSGLSDSLERQEHPVQGPPTLPEFGPDLAENPGLELSAVGESVMLASLPELQAAFPGIWVDAAVSRGLHVGVGIVESLAAQGQLRGVVVVGLGTNGPVDPADLERLRTVAAERPIVLINAHGDRWWIPEVNATLAAFAAAERGVVLADWDAAIAPYPSTLR